MWHSLCLNCSQKQKISKGYIAMDNMPDYGLWKLVIISSVVFLFFVFSFFRPRTSRDWRTFGTFSAFIIALFTEMYGFPLTIYLLSGWLSSRFPEVDWLSHNAGHILQTALGWQGDAHFGPLHISCILSVVYLFSVALCCSRVPGVSCTVIFGTFLKLMKYYNIW